MPVKRRQIIKMVDKKTSRTVYVLGVNTEDEYTKLKKGKLALEKLKDTKNYMVYRKATR